MAKNNGNRSSIGTGSHPQRYFTGSHKSKRRSRYKCIFYSTCTHICEKLDITCVGPSNSLCKFYSETRKNENKKTNEPVVGSAVFSESYGVGLVLRKINNDEKKYVVKFVQSGKEKIYSEKRLSDIIF